MCDVICENPPYVGTKSIGFNRRRAERRDYLFLHKAGFLRLRHLCIIRARERERERERESMLLLCCGAASLKVIAMNTTRKHISIFILASENSTNHFSRVFLLISRCHSYTYLVLL